MEYNNEEYKALLKKMLSEKRYQHSLYVAEQARMLAEIYKADTVRAYTAGLLHDICKDMSKREQLKVIEEAQIQLDDVVMDQPQLWHSLAGAAYVERHLGITDPQMLAAIRYHTSARKGMCLLEQIVYLADLTSEDRNYPDIEVMRYKARTSLPQAMREALKFILTDLVKKESKISKDTYEAYNEYME